MVMYILMPAAYKRVDYFIMEELVVIIHRIIDIRVSTCINSTAYICVCSCRKVRARNFFFCIRWFLILSTCVRKFRMRPFIQQRENDGQHFSMCVDTEGWEHWMWCRTWSKSHETCQSGGDGTQLSDTHVIADQHHGCRKKHQEGFD